MKHFQYIAAVLAIFICCLIAIRAMEPEKTPPAPAVPAPAPAAPKGWGQTAWEAPGQVYSGASRAASTAWEYTTHAASATGAAASSAAATIGAWIPAPIKRTAQQTAEYVICLVQAYGTTWALRKAMTHPDEYSAIDSSVRQSKDLSIDEKNFIQTRKQAAENPLENLLNQRIEDNNHIPNIGFCFSGGGCRAMFETLGWLRGAEKTKLLDTALYVTGLSGSTWAINPWIASGKTVDKYVEGLIRPREAGFSFDRDLRDNVRNLSTPALYTILIMLGKKYVDRQSVGAVDLYGALLSELILRQLGSERQKITLSSLSKNVSLGRFPLPISTAVLGGSAAQKFRMRPWFECSPFDIGSVELNAFIPAWAFGRVFTAGQAQIIEPRNPMWAESYVAQAAWNLLMTYLQGNTQKQAEAKKLTQMEEEESEEEVEPRTRYFGREMSLGYIMGMCGSAFAVDLQNVLLEMLRKFEPTQVCAEEQENKLLTQEQTINLLKKIISWTLGSTFAYVNSPAVANAVSQYTGGTLQDAVGFLTDENYGAATIPNFTYGMLGSPLTTTESISLVDGGFDVINGNRLNLALMPLLRPERDMDVIFVCDSSGILENAPALKAAEDRARASGLKFPRIDYTDIHKKPISIFIDERDATVPIIIYMPAVANPALGTFDPTRAPFAATTNFTYLPSQSETLVRWTEATMVTYKDLIIEQLKKAVERRKKKHPKGWVDWMLGR